MAGRKRGFPGRGASGIDCSATVSSFISTSMSDDGKSRAGGDDISCALVTGGRCVAVQVKFRRDASINFRAGFHRGSCDHADIWMVGLLIIIAYESLGMSVVAAPDKCIPLNLVEIRGHVIIVSISYKERIEGITKVR